MDNIHDVGKIAEKSNYAGGKSDVFKHGGIISSGGGNI